jgi:hypothetical protein
VRIRGHKTEALLICTGASGIPNNPLITEVYVRGITLQKINRIKMIVGFQLQSRVRGQ